MGNCPADLMATVIQLEEMSVSEVCVLCGGKELHRTRANSGLPQDTRKRYRYLDHLPITCEFIMAELDLTPYLSADTRSHFKGTCCGNRM